MKSISEQSFGKKLENANALSTLISGFTGFVTLNPLVSVAALNTLTSDIKGANSNVAGNLQSYTMTIDQKQKVFNVGPTSIKKITTPVIANVRSLYGKTSQEAESVNNFVVKIRGEKVAKPTANANAETISKSQRSYGSVLQNFSDMITTLDSFETPYQSAKTDYTIASLILKKDEATLINTKSVQEFGKLKLARDTRNTQYEQLSDLSQRLKDAVKAQYGNSSPEFKLVKGLKI